MFDWSEYVILFRRLAYTEYGGTDFSRSPSPDLTKEQLASINALAFPAFTPQVGEIEI